MSTKKSIKWEHDQATGQRFHLYEEVFVPDQVYLEVIGVPFEVPVWSNCPVADRTGS